MIQLQAIRNESFAHENRIQNKSSLNFVAIKFFNKKHKLRVLGEIYLNNNFKRS
jgi:hypothetical protein